MTASEYWNIWKAEDAAWFRAMATSFSLSGSLAPSLADIPHEAGAILDVKSPVWIEKADSFQ
jgi:hypothetical protein